MISKYIDKFIVKIHINNVFYLIFINLRKLNFRPQNIYFKYFNICILNIFNHVKLLARGGLIVSSTRDWYE